MYYLDYNSVKQQRFTKNKYDSPDDNLSMIFYKNDIIIKEMSVTNISDNISYYIFEINTNELSEGQYHAKLMRNDELLENYLIQIGNFKPLAVIYKTDDKIIEYNP